MLWCDVGELAFEVWWDRIEALFIRFATRHTCRSFQQWPYLRFSKTPTYRFSFVSSPCVVCSPSSHYIHVLTLDLPPLFVSHPRALSLSLNLHVVPFRLIFLSLSLNFGVLFPFLPTLKTAGSFRRRFSLFFHFWSNFCWPQSNLPLRPLDKREGHVFRDAFCIEPNLDGPGNWDHLRIQTTFAQSLRWSLFTGLTSNPTNRRV